MDSIKHLVGNIPSVSNMYSSSNRPVANQYLIETNEFSLFQSYRSPIAMIKDGAVFIFKDWDYSITTGKYRNIFLGETKKETLSKLKSREYIAVDFKVE